MRTLAQILLVGFFSIFSMLSQASNAEWLNITNGSEITTIKEHGDFLWIGTKGGITRIDQITGEQTFFNQGNSGLPSNSVEDIEFDSQNNIWIGTYDMGMVKFDGNDWELINPETHPNAPNQIYDLAIDDNDNVWIGTTMELIKYDGVDFTEYMLPTYAAVTSILYLGPNDMMLSWDINTPGAEALFHFNGSFIDTVAGLNDKDGIYRLYQDMDDNIWACFNGGLAKKETIGWTVYDSTNSALPNVQVRAMTEDINGTKYIGTESGVFQFDGVNFQALNLDQKQVNYLQIDADDNLWIGTLEDGLSKYADAEVTHFATANSASPRNIYRGACEAADGSLWFVASWPQAVVQFDGNNWIERALPNGITSVSAIQADANGNVWMTNYDELFKFDGNDWTVWNYDSVGATVTSVSSFMVTASGEVWLGSYNDGLVHFDGNNWTAYNEANSGLTSNTVFNIASGADGKVYVGLHNDNFNNVWQGGGLAVFNGSSFTMYSESNSGIVSNYISDIYVDGDSVWLGGDKGMSLFYNGSWTNFKHNESAIPLPGIKEMAGDHNGNIFFVGYGDLMGHYDGTSFHTFDNSNSPIRNFSSGILDMFFDTNGNLWMLTSAGVFLYKRGGVSGIGEIPSSIFDGFEENKLAVYPNPFQDYILLDLTTIDAQEFVFELFDMSGKSVVPATRYANTGAPLFINLPELKQGFYIYQVRGEHMESVSGKIIAQ